MTPGFRLAAVLRVRRVQEDRALAELRQTRDAARAAHQAAAQADAALSTAQVPDGARPGQWRAVTAARLALAGEAAAALASARAAEAEVDAALARWQATREARRGVERLEEIHHERMRVEAERITQRELDDRPWVPDGASETDERTRSGLWPSRR